MRKLLAALTFAVGLTGAAQADTITLNSAADIGKTFIVNYDGNINTINIPGLGATADFTLVSVAGNTWTFDIDLTVVTSGGISARVSSLGFNTNPNLVSASSTGLFNQTVLGGGYPNQFGAIEVCFKDGGGPNCQGGGGGGTYTTGSFTVALNLGSPVSDLTVENFGVRYQSVTGATPCTGECGSGTGHGALLLAPEPASWAMMIAGFGLLGWRVRASRKAHG